MGAKKIKPVNKKKPGKSAVLEDSNLEKLKIWVEKNSTIVLGVTAAVLLTIITMWGLKAYEGYKENKARTGYAALASKLPAEDKVAPADMAKLIPDLQKFVSENKGTRPALVAQIELAKAFYQAKRYDESIKAASEALPAVPAGQGLKPLIQYQLAIALEAAGKPDEALKQWAQLKESGGTGLEREADWSIGRIYAAKKDYSKAAEAFLKAAESPGAYPPQGLLDQELARVKQDGAIPETAAK